MARISDPKFQKPLAQRLLWFAALWLGGVGTVGLVAYGEVDRRDFDLRWDVRTPTDAPLAGHRVKIEAQIGAVKQTD